jgi:hypothetical protein
MKFLCVCVVALFAAAPLCLGDEEHDGNDVGTAVGKAETADHAAWRTLLVDKIGTLKKSDRDRQTDEALKARDLLNQELPKNGKLDNSVHHAGHYLVDRIGAENWASIIDDPEKVKQLGLNEKAVEYLKTALEARDVKTTANDLMKIAKDSRHPIRQAVATQELRDRALQPIEKAMERDFKLHNMDKLRAAEKLKKSPEHAAEVLVENINQLKLKNDALAKFRDDALDRLKEPKTSAIEKKYLKNLANAADEILRHRTKLPTPDAGADPEEKALRTHARNILIAEEVGTKLPKDADAIHPHLADPPPSQEHGNSIKGTPRGLMQGRNFAPSRHIPMDGNQRFVTPSLKKVKPDETQAKTTKHPYYDNVDVKMIPLKNDQTLPMTQADETKGERTCYVIEMRDPYDDAMGEFNDMVIGFQNHERDLHLPVDMVQYVTASTPPEVATENCWAQMTPEEKKKGIHATYIAHGSPGQHTSLHMGNIDGFMNYVNGRKIRFASVSHLSCDVGEYADTDPNNIVARMAAGLLGPTGTKVGPPVVAYTDPVLVAASLGASVNGCIPREGKDPYYCRQVYQAVAQRGMDRAKATDMAFDFESVSGADPTVPH